MNDKVKEILEQLEGGVKSVFDSEKYKKYLKTMSSFHNYSFNNSLLISMQNPEATYVAGFTTWKKLKRYVVKGEKGIAILAPCGFNRYIEKDKINPDTKKPVINPNTGKVEKVKIPVDANRFRAVYVFDISQTKGEPLQLNLIEELKGEVKDYKKFFESLKEAADYKIVFENIKGNVKGYCDFSKEQIVIKDGMDEKHVVKTAVHEIAHSLLHGKDNKYNNEISRKAAEVQAESVAYVVCSHYGIETGEYSFGYIAGWSRDKKTEELKESLSVIQKTSNFIINRVDDKYRELGLLKDNKTEEKAGKSLDDLKKQINDYRHNASSECAQNVVKKDLTNER